MFCHLISFIVIQKRKEYFPKKANDFSQLDSNSNSYHSSLIKFFFIYKNVIV